MAKEGNRLSVTVPIHRGRMYSFRIVAFNDGGKSFPSETLAVGTPGEDSKTVLIVNNFTRISAPAWFDTPGYGGFMDNIDSGVPYIREINFVGEMNQFDRTKAWTDDDNPGFGGSYTNRGGRIVAGNTFDYPALHGRVLLNAGYAFCSVSADYFPAMDTAPYAAVDLICGKQVTTRVGRGAIQDRYTVFPVPMQDALRDYAAKGGSILVAGAYIGTDAWDQVYPGTFPIKNGQHRPETGRRRPAERPHEVQPPVRRALLPRRESGRHRTGRGKGEDLPPLRGHGHTCGHRLR